MRVRFLKQLLVLLTLFGGVPASAEEAAPQGPPTASPAASDRADLLALVEPIALHDDALLELVLAASRHTDQLHIAASFARVTTRAVQGVGWDSSVQGLVYYPEVLVALDDSFEQTRRLGLAISRDEAAVRAAIASVRAREQAAGRLTSNTERTVAVDAQGIQIAARALPPQETTAWQPMGGRPTIPRPVYGGYGGADVTTGSGDASGRARFRDPQRVTTVHNAVAPDLADRSPRPGTRGSVTRAAPGPSIGTLSGTPGGTLSGTPGGSFSGNLGGTFGGTPGGTFSGTPGGTATGKLGGPATGREPRTEVERKSR